MKCVTLLYCNKYFCRKNTYPLEMHFRRKIKYFLRMRKIVRRQRTPKKDTQTHQKKPKWHQKIPLCHRKESLDRAPHSPWHISTVGSLCTLSVPWRRVESALLFSPIAAYDFPGFIQWSSSYIHPKESSNCCDLVGQWEYVI